MSMVEDEFSLDDYDIGFRKTVSDKLNWRIEIQKRMDICITTYGTTMFFKNVERLTKTIIFNIHGYRFKREIEKKKMELNYNKYIQIEYLRRYDRDTWYHPLKKGIRLLELNNDYYEKLYDFICQLIAEKGLLLDTEKIIPIRISNIKQQDEL